MTEAPLLGQRALNRALLERQLLLRRSASATVADVVAHLLGLQAQAPMPPYLGLWSRMENFDPHELGRMLTDREAVRLTLMRGTIHLVTADDALLLRPLLQHVIERVHGGAFGRRLAGVDMAVLVAEARRLVAAEPLTARDIGRALVARGIGTDVEAVGSGATVHGRMLQVPPRGVWGAGGQAKWAAIEDWTGRPLAASPSIDDLVLRYLRSFGPASVMDMQNWSGLTRLREVFERLRPQLAVFRAESDGRELFDLPDAPRPDPSVAAPVRFLGEYDNVLLGHADRTRIGSPDFPWSAMLAGGRYVNNLLVDGMLRATWWIERDGKRRAVLAIRPWGELSAADRDAVEAEAKATLEFATPGVRKRDVRFEAPV